MDPMLNEYRNIAKTVKKLDGNNCKYISGMRGGIVDADQVNSEYWVEHTREKVLFMDASKKAVELGCKTFIEIGPQPVLAALTMMNNDLPLTCLPSLKRNEENWETLLSTLGKLYVKGLEVDWKGVDQFYDRKKVSLPHYPFIGKKFWPDLLAIGSTIHPLIGSIVPNATSTKIFQNGLNLRALEYVKDHAIGDNVIFPFAGYLEMCLAAGLATIEGNTDSLSTPTGAMKIENLSIEAPLVLQDGKTCQVQTVVDYNTSRDNENDLNEMKVSIFRRVELESEKWLAHARATFSPIVSVEEKAIEFDINQFQETLTRPSNEGEISQIYDKLASVGLKFGSTFRSIEKIWRKESSLLAKVKIPTEDEGQNQYIVHPVLIDAMIQAVMMLRTTSSLKKKLYVPIKIGKFIWFHGRDTTTDLYVHAIESREKSKAPSSSSAFLVDSTATVLAVMSSIELIDTTVKAIDSILEQQTISMPDMWEEVWKSQVGPLQHSTDLKAAIDPQSTVEFLQLMEGYNNLAPHFAETFAQLENLSYLYFLKALYDCGWEPILGKLINEDALFKELRIKSNFRQYFSFILETLGSESILKRNEKDGWVVQNVPPTVEQVVATLSTPLFTMDLPQKFFPTLLLTKFGENLGGVLRGEVSPLNILFPEENKGYSVYDFYQDYGNMFLLKEGGCAGFRRRFQNICSAMKGKRFILKVLEVGAGTGSFSSDFIQCLDEQGIEFELHYTDISAAFFPFAEKKFEKHLKSIKFMKLNIEEDPIEQGFTPEYYDYVYGAEVIHATRDIKESLRNIRLLMKPYGKMDIIDQTRVNRIITFLFGGLEGFWRFQDFDIRTNHCTISSQKWEEAFLSTGFVVDGTFPILFGYHSLMGVHKSEEPQRNLMPMIVNKKSWLLFREEGCIISDYLMEKIQNSAVRQVVPVEKGNSFQVVENGFRVRSWNEDDFHELFKSMKAKGLEVEGIIYCWALNKEITSQDEILQPYFYLTKAVLELPAMNPRIVVVTNGGTVPLVENDMSHFHSSTLWGFNKSLKNENVSINCSCVELIKDPDEELGQVNERRLGELFYEIWNCNKDVQVAYFGGNRFIPKFVAHKPLINSLQLPKGTDRFQLILPDTKSISDLQFGPLDLPSSDWKEYEVEVQIKASALNFRDVLSVIKPTDQFKNINAVGFDFAGVVKKIGGKVTKWKPGDRVSGCNMENSALPSHAVLHQDLLISLPENMTLCEAATIPAVYVTSVVCLIETAKIKKGDVVLLHTATGGVGLSAIEICKHVGCTIIATAGSKRKQNYLRSLGIKQIFHSRNTQYGDDILKATNGRGVDVVLNSLTSEGFKEATLKACAKGARFIEMSKLNIWKPEQVKELRPDVDYTIVDVSSADAKEWNRFMEVLRDLMDKQVVKPIPYVRFDGLNVREALQYMQKVKHIGKIVCVMPELRQEDGKMKVYTPMFNAESTYLITGGLGGIGFVVCKWMLESGAKNIILAGRSPPNSSTQSEIHEMNSKGANVIPFQLDVSNFEQCKNLIQIQIEKMGLPPLRGVMHAAGTLADGVIVNLDWSKLSSTFSTKISGTLNLHELTRNLNLEHFVMFSSTASILGPPGQCNHAAGNCFEDAFTHYRNSIGLPGTTINWGQWGEVGIATEVDLPGVKTLSNVHGMTGLCYVLKAQRTQTCILNVSSFLILSKLFPQISSYLDERIWKKTAVAGVGLSTIKSDEFWHQYDSFTDLEEKAQVLKAQLHNILRNTLKLDENEVIGDDMDMQEMGVDSLMFVEIKNGLQTLLGGRLTVSSSSLKNSNTVNLMTSSLVKLIEGVENEVKEEVTKPTQEEVSKLMREDAQLPEHIKPKPDQNIGNVKDIKTVLLTGCTGTLGPYLLKQLTTTPQISQVVCLIRQSKFTTLEERLNKTLKGLNLLPSVDMGKIRCIAGNVAEPHLGMDPEVWDELSQTVDAIISCAAFVSHTQLYRKTCSKNDMRAVNIGGTKNILEFAAHNKLKHVLHTSTMVAVSTIDDKTGRLSETWPEVEDFDHVTTLGYPVSKFVGDVLMKQASERGIPVKVFRLPIISGESQTGRCSIENNHVLLRYLFIMKCGIMPSLPLPFATLSVDTCAKASIQIFLDEKAPVGIYNICHPNPEVDQAFVNVAKRFGYHVDITEFSEFAKRVVDSGEGGNEIFSMFKDFYISDDAIVAFFSASAVQKWIEGNQSEINDMWRSNKVERFLPGFYDHIPNTTELFYRDLAFLKSKGWFDKFGL